MWGEGRGRIEGGRGRCEAAWRGTRRPKSEGPKEGRNPKGEDQSQEDTQVAEEGSRLRAGPDGVADADGAGADYFGEDALAVVHHQST